MDIESTVVVVDGKEWQSELPDLGDLKVLVAPWENPAFERAMQKGIKALPQALRADGNIEPAAYRRVLGTVIAKTILFGWENYAIGGVAKPFEQTYAEQMLKDPRYRVFTDGVIMAAKRVQLGIVAEQTDIVGNSQTSSSGSGTGDQTSSS
jgi:hypothetical protein